MLNQTIQEIAINPTETPDFINQLNYLDLIRLLKLPNLSEWFLEQALQRNEGQIWFLVSRHPNITDRIKAKLIATKNGRFCLYFAQQKNLSNSLIFQLAQVEVESFYLRKNIRLAIINNPSTKLDIIENLAQDINYTVRTTARRAIASHPQTSLSVIETLAFDAESIVKKAIALRHDLPIELIRKMAKNHQIACKGFLVRNSYFDRDLLDKLAQDFHPRVQQLVALHPNTSEETLARIAENPAIGVFVLQNPNLTAEIFEELASSNNPKLHLALAQHPRTSKENLADIATKSEDAATLIAVAENNQIDKKTKSKVLSWLASFSSRSVRQYVAKNPCTPDSILWNWGTNKKCYKLHPFIAKNPASPTILLDYLAHNFFSPEVWKGLVLNPNTSEDTFSYLCFKEKKQRIVNGRKVVSIAKEHKIPLHILKKLIRIKDYSAKSAWFLVDLKDEQQEVTFETIDQLIKIDKRYYYEGDRTYGIYLIQNCNLPLATVEFLLEQIAQSKKVDKRKFVARHSKTPISVLRTLVQDKDRSVRDAATFRLQKKSMLT